MDGLGKVKGALKSAVYAGIKRAAMVLLQDCRPYIPMLTGALRDSGHVEQLTNYAVKIVWDAANPLNGFIYAEKQYEEVLQHVDGKYAAEWIKRTLDANPGRYKFLANLFVGFELERALR